MTIEQAKAVETHPVIILDRILARYREAQLTFSRYQIGPSGDQFKRPRTIFNLDAKSATEHWLNDELKKLGSEEELALHSRVSLAGEFAHVPMIDFDRELPLSSLRDLGCRALCEFAFRPSSADFEGSPTLYSFKTGRSYHQYADVLIVESDWHRFLGNLLLLNPTSGQPIVDVRWVAYALKRGYAALRWSHNTQRYVSTPLLVDRSELAAA